VLLTNIDEVAYKLFVVSPVVEARLSVVFPVTSSVEERLSEEPVITPRLAKVEYRVLAVRAVDDE